MSTRLYDYILLPQQLSILFEYYSILTYEVLDSYIYACDVCNGGTIKKTEFICVHIKKYGEPTIYSNSMAFTEFMGKCLSNEIKLAVPNNKKNR
jgi:hypothetical protein